MTEQTHAETARLSPVVELRQYDLAPGTRDTLIDIFDRHLIEGQEAEEMTIIGQFRDLDNPDSFVWLRGFACAAPPHAGSSSSPARPGLLG